jgi:type VI secretion system protein ImpC
MPEEQKQPESAAAERPAGTTGAGLTLLDKIVQEGKMVRDPSQTPYAKDLIETFVGQVLDEGMVVSRDTVTSIKTRIAQLDELLSLQLNEVMHSAEFQALESAWRGLHYLVMNSETGTQLKIRLLNITKQEIVNDLEKATEFDQSTLFKRIYEDEYGTFGGNPISVLVGDFEFGRMPQDIATLEKLGSVAAAAHAPLIAAASPKLFDWESFTEMNAPRDLSKGFETAELIKWRSFRATEDSRYVALVMPHVLLRLPYGPDTVPVEGFNFVENVNGKDHSKYLWGNAAYAMGQRISEAFSLHHWCAAIRGVEGGGAVTGLPTHTFKTDQGDVALKCPTEIAITDRREKELSDLGFIALCHCKGTDYAAFFGGQTTNKPKAFNTNAANANARISSMLPYVLAASRFAHYIKVIMRDKIGSFMTRDNVQKYLTTWISDYVLLNDDAPQVIKAKFPLREARIDVTEVPGKPGVYKAVVFLKPHFQLDELTVSLRLVADLPAPAAG